MAKVWNRRMFQHIKRQADDASVKLAHERGACPDAADYGIMERFSNKMAIAPTASISIICGGASPGIEPNAANAYTHKTLSGSFPVKNPYPRKTARGKRVKYRRCLVLDLHQRRLGPASRLPDAGRKRRVQDRVRNRPALADRACGDRTPFVCQAQSLNVFLPANVHKAELHRVHFEAWKKGVKSLYYCRSKSIQRAESDASWKRSQGEAPRSLNSFTHERKDSIQTGSNSPRDRRGGTGVRLSDVAGLNVVFDFRLNELREVHQRFLPTEIAAFGRDSVRNSLLHDIDFGAD
jgi:ribonucleoside-diphosphate reductase alpha chain